MGDTPERKKGESLWRMQRKLRRKARGKRVGMGSGMECCQEELNEMKENRKEGCFSQRHY